MDISLVIFYCFEALPLLVSLFYLNKVRDNHFKWFAFYLLYIFIADLFGEFMNIMQIHNQWFYACLVIPVEFAFFFWLFYKASMTKTEKRLPIIFLGIYSMSLIFDFLYFAKHLFPFYSFSYSIGNLLLLILIISFFIQLTNSDLILTYRNNMMFWISIGLLIFYLGSLPYYGLFNEFAFKYVRLNIIYNKVSKILDCTMYLMFAFSFIWGKPNLQSSQSSST